MAGDLTPAAAGTLPPFREDLEISRGPVSDNSPTWTVYDPASHQYARIGWAEVEMIGRWGLGSPAEIAAAVSAETTMELTADDVVAFAAFADRACLLTAPHAGATARFVARQAAKRHSAATWLLHNYLFLRIRLVDPDRFLEATFPLVGWMFTWGFVRLLVLGAAVSAIIVSRHWDTASHELGSLFSLEGVLSMGVALSFAKVVHELGHGYAAKSRGCRVPGMGVAFLVLAPVLWTDTSDAWRLVRRKDRLLVDAGGMLAELTLAVVSTFAWSALPDGGLRDATFRLATSTWILTLAVNLSPLMRFDGYYILSDLLGVANLQERGFAVARWWMRRQLTGLVEPPPEPLAPGRLRALLAYSYGAWIYRFGLFLGIALMVYHFSFKALGFFLMGVELWYFLTKPILREVGAGLRSARRAGPNARLVATCCVLLAAAFLAAWPWHSSIGAPGLIRAARQADLTTSEPGTVGLMVPTGQYVMAGQTVVQLRSDLVDHDMEASRARLEGLEADTTGQQFDPGRRGHLSDTAEERAKAAAEVAAASVRNSELAVVAPFAGILVDVPPWLHPGMPVPRHEPVGTLVDGSSAVAEAYFGEADLPRLSVGAEAWFYPVDGSSRIHMEVSGIATTSSRTIEVPELASVDGGPIATHKDPAGGREARPVPEAALYQVRLSAPGVPCTRRLVGTVVVMSRPTSFLAETWRRAVSVAMREFAL